MSDDGFKALSQAIFDNDLDRVTTLLVSRVSPDDVYEYGYTHLMTAIENGSSDAIIQSLIDYSTNLDYQDIGDGFTALMIATMKNNVYAVAALLERGVNVNLQDDDGQTALMFACDNPKIVQLLLDAGADVNIQNRDKETAAFGAGVRCLKLLIDAGIDLNLRDKRGRIALIDALAPSRNTDLATIKLLLQHSDLTITDEDNKTILMLAAQYKTPEIIQLVIDAGVDINAQDKYGYTAVMREHLDQPVLQLLIDAGADLDIKNVNGDTLLHIVQIDTLDFITAHVKPNVDIPNNDGITVRARIESEIYQLSKILARL